MSHSAPTEIKSSRFVITLQFLVPIIYWSMACVFFFLGNELLNMPERAQWFMAIVCAVIGLYNFAQLMIAIKHRHVRVIIQDGILVDQTKFSRPKEVKLGDIVKIEVRERSGRKYLLIFVRNPKEYLRQAKGMTAAQMGSHVSLFGTPLVIATGTLTCSADELTTIIKDAEKS